MLFRYLRFNREKLYHERLKMIEAGHPLEDEDSDSTKRQKKYMHNAFWISFWMVVSVPAASFKAAATATDRIQPGPGYLLIIWIGASATSVAAVICAAVLMVHPRSGREDKDNLVLCEDT